MSREEILNIVNDEKKGFHIGNRMILPFKCNILKLIADSHIYTEFIGNQDIKISQEQKNTSIYFREAGKLNRFEGGYKSVKLLIASEEDDLTDPENFIKVIAHILPKHKVELEIPAADDIFIV